MNHKREEQIWRREGRKLQQKQPERGRLWLNDGSCIRLRPEHKDNVWSYDFVQERTADNRNFRILAIIDDYSQECLTLPVRRHIKSQDLIDCLYRVLLLRGIPAHIRSDNSPEFTVQHFRNRLERIKDKTLFIE